MGAPKLHRRGRDSPANWHDDMRYRMRMSAAKLLPVLEKCALGEHEMSTAAVRAAELIFRKVLPDLTAAELHVRDHRPIADYSTDELLAILGHRDGEGRIIEALPSVPEPSGVH